MKTNEIFDIKRFGTYWLTDLKACINQYGLALLLIGFIGLITYVVAGIYTLVFSGSWYSMGEVGWALMLGVGFAILIMSMSVKCYGQITEKRAGSLFLSIPVSTFEKYLSMVINIGIVFPLAYGIIYLSTNLVVSFLDPESVKFLLSYNLHDLEIVRGLFENQIGSLTYFISPWTMIDDALGAAYTFLLGAIFFRKNKTVLTILAVMAFGMVLSTITSPFIINYVNDIDALLDQYTDQGAIEYVNNMFNNMKIIDIINDIVTLIALNVAIFFRIKTLKH